MNALPATENFAGVWTPLWLVLRCSPARTLALADSLNDAGIEAWAPADEGAPLIARYVFARRRHLPELLEIIHNPFMTYKVWDSDRRRMVNKGHPYFTLMRNPGSEGWATVRDYHLDALRRIEGRRKPRGIVKSVPVGATVRLMDGSFQGLDGIVLSVRNKFAMVSFAGFPVPVQIGCWLLTEKVDVVRQCG